MGGASSLNKGKRAEREVVRMLQPVVDSAYDSLGYEAPVLERNLMQSNRGGHDIVGMEWLALEVKHHATLKLVQWWEQTLAQAGDSLEPVLIYKQTHGKWKVRMYGQLLEGVDDLLVPVDIAVDDFMLYLWHRVRRELEYCER